MGENTITGNKEINFLNATSFKLQFTRLPAVEFTCQTVSLPSMILGGPVIVGTTFSDLQEPGDKITMDQLNVTFLVDEKMNNYIEVYDWIVGLGFPDEFEQFKRLKSGFSDIAPSDGLTSDANIVIINNNSIPIKRINFKACFPVSLGTVTFDNTPTEIEPLIVEASFGFRSRFVIEDL